MLTPIPGQPAFYPAQPTTTPTMPGGYAEWQAGATGAINSIIAALKGGPNKKAKLADPWGAAQDAAQDAQQDQEDGD